MDNINRTFVQLVQTPIRMEPLLPLLDDPDCGAQSWFHGVTRRTTMVDAPSQSEPGSRSQCQITETLFYESHQTMALKQLHELADNALQRFGLSRIVIVHRLGEVPIGEASVVIGCCSAHRRNSFDALPWMMDELKSNVAIWKQERLQDGSTLWVHPTTP
ncbi:Molybdopterin synthase catalytic subunit [Stieleria varia]|uniref:Molybdopterin synthase catalytic subunit n=2 Tax=Stieleria varia TaxID=2528005 RepID=A0A5C6B9E4_9BACT|nr:Molybdopterin synthase catalytic subunit [Stieleria varia]